MTTLSREDLRFLRVLRVLAVFATIMLGTLAVLFAAKNAPDIMMVANATGAVFFAGLALLSHVTVRRGRTLA